MGGVPVGKTGTPALFFFRSFWTGLVGIVRGSVAGGSRLEIAGVGFLATVGDYACEYDGTLNPKPSTLNPKPLTLNPEP